MIDKHTLPRMVAYRVSDERGGTIPDEYSITAKTWDIVSWDGIVGKGGRAVVQVYTTPERCAVLEMMVLPSSLPSLS